MSNKRGIVLTVILCLAASIFSSFFTAILMKNNIAKNSNNTPTQIVSSGGKNQNIYQAVSTKAMPSVVGITTKTISTNNIFAIPTESEGVGTGVIVDSNGYILTNSHVVSNGQAVDVNVLFNDGSNTKGKVLWSDSSLDLAIVKVERTGLTSADLGDSDSVKTGDIAIAIGNPLGLEFQKSVTQGIISGLDRTIKTEQSNMTGLMQTDASINPGNSGGPLLNEKGQVIGINTAKASQGEGLGFAIPINTAKPIVEQIIKSGNFEKVTLGIKGIDVSVFEAATGQNLEAKEGVYIVEVVDATAAQKAGIQAGDVITKVGDTDIATMSDLNKALYRYSKGKKTTVSLNRGGKAINLNLTF